MEAIDKSDAINQLNRTKLVHTDSHAHYAKTVNKIFINNNQLRWSANIYAKIITNNNIDGKQSNKMEATDEFHEKKKVEK